MLDDNRIKYFSVTSDKKGAGSNYYNDGAGKEAIAIGPNAKAGDNSVAIGLSAKTGNSIIDKDSYNSIKRLYKEISEGYKKAVKDGDEEAKTKYEKLKNAYEEMQNSYEERYEYNGKLITKADLDNLGKDEKKEAKKNIKYVSNATYKNSVAIGNDAQALANDTIAIGSGAKAIAQGGVAIGQGSVSNARRNSDLKGYRPKAFSIDETSEDFKRNKSAWIATDQPFAVGNDKKLTRQITGVAAGSRDTDAVNVAQLKQVGFRVAGDIGEIGNIKNEDKDYNILNIKTDDKWHTNDVIYTGKNLETKFKPGGWEGKHFSKAKFEITMSDTPTFKSITISDENTINGKEVENKDDNSPIELKKFGDNIGFTGKNDSTVKLTNLTDGEINATSTDAFTGKQLFKVQEKTNTLANTPLKFADNNNKIIDRKLGEILRISGGQEINPNIKEDDFTIGKNIGVFAKDDGNLTVALAKNLTDLESVTIKDGTDDKVTLTKDGLNIIGGPNITNKGIYAGNMQIKNVADGTDKTDAVNKG